MMGGWGGYGIGWIFMFLWWVIIVALVVGLIRWLFMGHVSDGGSRPVAEAHLDILKERYARGEIDHDMYERMRRDLES
ncbi:SHOCT domain-containing protein [Thiomonas sp.]